MHDATLQLVDGGVRVQYGDCDKATCKSDWLRVDASGAHRDPVQHAQPDAITLAVDYRGGALSLPLVGFALSGNRLVAGTASVGSTAGIAAPTSTTSSRRALGCSSHSTVDRCECDSGFEGQI